VLAAARAAAPEWDRDDFRDVVWRARRAEWERFRAEVAASPWLAVLLSVLGAVGAACLGLVLRQLLPQLGWWPLLLALLGPAAGLIYRTRAMRAETLELRLISHDSATGSALRLRAHRDELIALELEMGPKLGLFSDGKLLSSPI
jgi:hypothetical protein